MKKILLTGGGTAGHVTPNIALLPRLRESGFDIFYIGTRSGIEDQLMTREGVPFYAISAGKLRRYFDIKNFTDVFHISAGFFQSLNLLLRLRPDIVFSKGGFVSCPVVWAAWFLRIPVVIHESDITPGLANRLSLPFVKKICYSFPETAKHLAKKKAVHTGLPIRETLRGGNADEGKRLCEFRDDKPAVLIMGGSQGSKIINDALREALPDLLPEAFLVCNRRSPPPLCNGDCFYRKVGSDHPFRTAHA
jgi:UDP-N-acetylglucosamine--N-acetylmuramyl-(pentapeptide) pyrophosphoryl-undecaprenol N-acetylglucosamine transferase